MLPLIILLVFEDKVVAHDNQVTVVFSVFQSTSKDIAKGIKA